MKKRVLIFLFFLFLSVSVFGKGEKESDFVIADGKDDWQASFDISGMEDGNYNYLVKVKDKMGNVTYDGPYDFKIDEKSDIPSSKIISPLKNTIISNTWNIIGVASDDDNVKSVYVAIVEDPKLKNNKKDLELWNKIYEEADYELASGTDYWSYIFNPNEYKDGKYYLLVKVVDIKGNVSLGTKTSVFINKKVPDFELENDYGQEALSGKFVLNGFAFDESGIKNIYYSLNGGKSFTSLKMLDSEDLTKVPFSLELDANKISTPVFDVCFKAVDNNKKVGLAYYRFNLNLEGGSSFSSSKEFKPNGTRVDELYNISRKEKPIATLTSPLVSEIVSGEVLFTGTAKGRYRIDKVLISFDNGVSYSKVTGTTSWRYKIDSNLFIDGIVPVLIKPVDKNNNYSIYSAIVRVDNTKPTLILKSPKYDSVERKNINFRAVVFDISNLESVSITISPVNSTSKVKPIVARINKLDKKLLERSIDVSRMASGSYFLSVSVKDKAGNLSTESTRIVIDNLRNKFQPEIIYPISGEILNGYFTVDGFVDKVNFDDFVEILVDGTVIKKVELNNNGYFNFEFTPEILSNGIHSIVARYNGEKAYSSKEKIINYQKEGAWLRIDNLDSGQSLIGNYTLKGSAGCFINKTDLKDDSKSNINMVKRVLVSFDNGQTYKQAIGFSNWKYRINNFKVNDGPVYMLVKAEFSNGENALRRIMYNLDQTPAEVETLSPVEDSSINESLVISGIATDQNDIEEVKVAFRDGPKSSYVIPSFLKGLYLDLKFLGATYFDLGLGIGFFDEIVKLQVQYGISPYNDLTGEVNRFYGSMMGFKLLARYFNVEFGKYYGPDLDFLSFSGSIGAGFSYVSMTKNYKVLKKSEYVNAGDDVTGGAKGGAFLGNGVFQFDLNFKVKDAICFNSWSLYYELALWFISSELQAGVIPSSSFGVKVGIL